MPCALSATPAVARAGAALGGEVCGDAWRRTDAECGCDPWGRRWWNCMALLVPFSPCVVCGPVASHVEGVGVSGDAYICYVYVRMER